MKFGSVLPNAESSVIGPCVRPTSNVALIMTKDIRNDEHIDELTSQLPVPQQINRCASVGIRRRFSKINFLDAFFVLAIYLASWSAPRLAQCSIVV